MATKQEKLASRMAALQAMEVNCHLSQADVSRIVITFVRDQGHEAATDSSRFPADIPVDGITRRGWAAPIRQRIFKAGCDPKGFGPEECEKAKKVGDISKAAFEAMS